MLWDPFLYCINDSIQGNSETGNKVFVLPSKVAINRNTVFFVPFLMIGYSINFIYYPLQYLKKSYFCKSTSQK